MTPSEAPRPFSLSRATASDVLGALKASPSDAKAERRDPTLFLAWRRRRGRSVSAAIVWVRRFSRDADIGLDPRQAALGEAPEHGILKLCGLVFDCDGLVTSWHANPIRPTRPMPQRRPTCPIPIYTGFGVCVLSQI